MNLHVNEYPGRLIIIGEDRSREHVVVAYAITGRSPSSQARKIVFDGDTAWVRPTDEQTLQQGDPELLIYPALLLSNGIAVGNGKQTETLGTALADSADPVSALAAAHSTWEFEPDAPNYTPRISGCLVDSNRAALGIIKRSNGGEPIRQYFEFPLEPGSGRLIATYTGENRAPLPSFRGEPAAVDLAGESAGETADALYAALAPENPDGDFRVSVLCLYAAVSASDDIEVSIVNRHQEKR